VPLANGTQMASYQITGLLGAGGMGEVYRAHDAKLNRDVAIKILPVEFAKDPERVARFHREAQAVAALNHPNIGAIHELAEWGSDKFLVLELVEGETLAERMRRGALPIEDALHYAKQIAEAMEAAHDKGVIHRDLKPANVKITPDGNVKVLDFGLAKALETAPSSLTFSNSPTLSLAATNPGVILGMPGTCRPSKRKVSTPTSAATSFPSAAFFTKC
jgi:eukaryotic-like serine/threonine-protein kinase